MSDKEQEIETAFKRWQAAKKARDESEQRRTQLKNQLADAEAEFNKSDTNTRNLWLEFERLAGVKRA